MAKHIHSIEIKNLPKTVSLAVILETAAQHLRNTDDRMEISCDTDENDNEIGRSWLNFPIGETYGCLVLTWKE
jgi:hypothetical protein